MKSGQQFTDLIDTLQLSTYYLKPSISMTLSESLSVELKLKREAGRAFRRLSKIHHPDHGGDPVIFMSVHNAYMSIKKYSLIKSPSFTGVGISVSLEGVSLISESDGGWSWVKK